MVRGHCVTNKTVESSFQIKYERIFWLFPIFSTSPPFYCISHQSSIQVSSVLFSAHTLCTLLSTLHFQALSPVFSMTSGWLCGFLSFSSFISFFFFLTMLHPRNSPGICWCCFSSLHCQLLTIHTWSFPILFI